MMGLWAVRSNNDIKEARYGSIGGNLRSRSGTANLIYSIAKGAPPVEYRGAAEKQERSVGLTDSLKEQLHELFV